MPCCQPPACRRAILGFERGVASAEIPSFRRWRYFLNRHHCITLRMRWPAIFRRAIRTGVIPVALNTLLRTEQYRYLLADTRALY